MKKLVAALLAAACLCAVCGCSGKPKPFKNLVKNGPYSIDPSRALSYTEEIAFDKDGTYAYSYNGEQRTAEGDVTHYQCEASGAFTEVLFYEYEYQHGGKIDPKVAVTDTAWIAIYRLENGRNYWTEQYGGSLYVALDESTAKRGKITLFWRDGDPTADYLDTLRADMPDKFTGQDHAGHIPLGEVGLEEALFGNTHRNVGDRSHTLVNEANKEAK